MTTAIDIRADHLEIVQDILSEHLPPDVKVWVFGSRANWTTKDSSDLDLALEGTGKVDRKVKGELMDAFEDSDLPYTVDIVDMNQVSDSFRQIVDVQKILWPFVNSQANQGTEWMQKTLGEICDLQGGSVFPRAMQGKSSGKYPFAKVSDMNLPGNEICIRDANNWVDDNDIPLLKAKPILPGATVFAKIGEALKQNRLRYLVQPTIVDNNMMGVVPKIDQVDSRYLYYALSQFDFGEVAGGTALPYLTMRDISSLTLDLPSLLEQRVIAHILRTLDDKTELNRRMNRTLEEMAHAIFKDWFIDFGPTRAKIEGREPYLPAEVWDLFPDSLVDSELGEVPDGWEVKSLGDLIELGYGKALKADNRNGGVIPVYGSNGRIGWHDQSLVSGPGIVVGRKGNPGIVTWAQSDFFPIDTTFYVVAKNENMSLLFLFYALDAQGLPSVAADSAVPGLNRNLAYMNRQLVPDGMVTRAFDRSANAFFECRYQLNEASHTLAAMRDALLPKLISGGLQTQYERSN